jgi:hypothetical protein
MGTGEYISVTNQNELVHAEVAVERRMHPGFPRSQSTDDPAVELKPCDMPPVPAPSRVTQ